MIKNALSSVSLACLEINFAVKGAGTVILLFRLEFKTSVICHNENTQKLLGETGRTTSLRCETFENLLHIYIAPVRRTLSGILH